ncbi:hypothetical protein SAMN06273572_1037 [Monaibacterium marinum]|uniref:Uncharacterized protein n=1 Tax=Pontivivens marinum TaxID=1690039 RepID=A0A2C9CS03_9RHOB|nr:hypothetical protein [Monaibacterium marinum]SOH93983.1 hypothetical protein SAMN06273572_1037 [Monaibacterium marinum]
MKFFLTQIVQSAHLQAASRALHAGDIAKGIMPTPVVTKRQESQTLDIAQLIARQDMIDHRKRRT